MRPLSCHGPKCRALDRTWMVKAMSEQTENIGAVSQSRYEQIVAELREVVEQQTRGQFTIGAGPWRSNRCASGAAKPGAASTRSRSR